MIAQDLLVLLRPAPFAVDPIRPLGEALVEHGARALQEAAVRGVLDQNVHEPEAGVIHIRRARSHELLARHGLEVGRDDFLDLSGSELLDGRLCEFEADDRSRLDDSPLVRRKEVQARCE